MRNSGRRRTELSKLYFSLENREENTCFSIRSFINKRLVRGVTHKLVNTVLTYDRVPEPGIRFANKYDTVGLEGLVPDLPFDSEDLNGAMELVSVEGLESDLSALTMVRTAQGWSKIQVITPVISALDWY